jgi:hypothetical protein
VAQERGIAPDRGQGLARTREGNGQLSGLARPHRVRRDGQAGSLEQLDQQVRPLLER